LQQLVHGGMALAGAGHQGPLAAVYVEQPVRSGRGDRGRVGLWRLLARWRVAVCGGWLAGRTGEAAAMRDNRLLDVSGQVVPQGAGRPSARCPLRGSFSGGPQPERRMRLSPHTALR
jgi:hypothetical protein